jgi:hypothetical protein
MTTYTSDVGKKDAIGAGEVFVVTTYTEDLTLAGNEANAAAVAAVLATLIKALQQKGIIRGTTTT